MDHLRPPQAYNQAGITRIVDSLGPQLIQSLVDPRTNEVIETDADVEFICEDGVKVKGHRIVFARFSKFFANIFAEQAYFPLTTVTLEYIQSKFMRMVRKLAYGKSGTINIAREDLKELCELLAAFGHRPRSFTLQNATETVGDFWPNYGNIVIPKREPGLELEVGGSAYHTLRNSEPQDDMQNGNSSTVAPSTSSAILGQEFGIGVGNEILGQRRTRSATEHRRMSSSMSLPVPGRRSKDNTSQQQLVQDQDPQVEEQLDGVDGNHSYNLRRSRSPQQPTENDEPPAKRTRSASASALNTSLASTRPTPTSKPQTKYKKIKEEKLTVDDFIYICKICKFRSLTEESALEHGKKCCKTNNSNIEITNSYVREAYGFYGDVQCPVEGCGKKYILLRGFVVHASRMHPEFKKLFNYNGKNECIICITCQSNFKTPEEFQRHLDPTTEQCPGCKPGTLFKIPDLISPTPFRPVTRSSSKRANLNQSLPLIGDGAQSGHPGVGVENMSLRSRTRARSVEIEIQNSCPTVEPELPKSNSKSTPLKQENPRMPKSTATAGPCAKANIEKEKPNTTSAAATCGTSKTTTTPTHPPTEEIQSKPATPSPSSSISARTTTGADLTAFVSTSKTVVTPGGNTNGTPGANTNGASVTPVRNTNGTSVTPGGTTNETSGTPGGNTNGNSGTVFPVFRSRSQPTRSIATVSPMRSTTPSPLASPPETRVTVTATPRTPSSGNTSIRSRSSTPVITFSPNLAVAPNLSRQTSSPGNATRPTTPSPSIRGATQVRAPNPRAPVHLGTPIRPYTPLATPRNPSSGYGIQSYLTTSSSFPLRNNVGVGTPIRPYTPSTVPRPQAAQTHPTPARNVNVPLSATSRQQPQLLHQAASSLPDFPLGSSSVSTIDYPGHLLNPELLNRELSCRVCNVRGGHWRDSTKCMEKHGYYRCGMCFNTYRSKATLTQHINQMHIDSDREHVCPICHKRSKNAGGAANHLYSSHWYPVLRTYLPENEWIHSMRNNRSGSSGRR